MIMCRLVVLSFMVMEQSLIFEFEEDEALKAAKFVQNRILKEGDLS